jgi:hypothetical protein
MQNKGELIVKISYISWLVIGILCINISYALQIASIPFYISMEQALYINIIDLFQLLCDFHYLPATLSVISCSRVLPFRWFPQSAIDSHY